MPREDGKWEEESKEILAEIAAILARCAEAQNIYDTGFKSWIAETGRMVLAMASAMTTYAGALEQFEELQFDIELSWDRLNDKAQQATLDLHSKFESEEARLDNLLQMVSYLRLMASGWEQSEEDARKMDEALEAIRDRTRDMHASIVVLREDLERRVDGDSAA